MLETDVNTVPHYFGPYSNWANSPQVLSDAVVTITLTGHRCRRTGDGDGESRTGAVTAIRVTNPGIGYTQTQTSRSPPGGLGATATAAVATGVVASIIVTTPAGGFTDPEVTIAPPATWHHRNRSCERWRRRNHPARRRTRRFDQAGRRDRPTEPEEPRRKSGRAGDGHGHDERLRRGNRSIDRGCRVPGTRLLLRSRSTMASSRPSHNHRPNPPLRLLPRRHPCR